MSNHTPESRDYQDRDIRLRPLILFLLGSALVTIASLIGGRILFQRLLHSAQQADTYALPFSPTRQIPPAPLLQVTPSADLAEHRAKEAALLNHYEWIDQEAGVVRIPIDRAMDLIAAAGATEESNP